MFDRFRRVDENSDRAGTDRSKGVGLGLSISKGFVEAIRGRIAATSPIRSDLVAGMRGTRILISPWCSTCARSWRPIPPTLRCSSPR